MPDENLTAAQQERKRLRSNRIKRYFVCAAKQILDTDGITAITTRRVSEMAGYNSGTLYNYFDDLDHVVFLACMENLERYNEKLAHLVETITSPLEQYLAIVDCFADFNHKDPKISWQLFYGCPITKCDTYVHQYYDLFPLAEPDQLQPMKQVKLTNNISERNMLFLSGCIEAGYITRENAELFDGLSSMIAKCMLEYEMQGLMGKEEAAAREKQYYRHTLKSYMKPEYQHLLKE